MRCEDLAARLTEFLEGDLATAVEAEALQHLATCPRCEAVLAETRDVMALASEHGRVRVEEPDRRRLLTEVLDRVASETDHRQASVRERRA